MFQEKTVRLFCLACQLPRVADLVVEQILNDAADLIRQVHRLQNGN